MGLLFQTFIACAPWTSPVGAESLQQGYQPPFQTQWQRAHSEAVAAMAAQKSEEALPELLAELDDADFRQELRECCPSLRGKTAKELLQRLTKLMSTVEVVSGFEANAKSRLSYLTGMSVDDGLTGTYFQSIWQRLVRHNQSFAVPSYLYGFANKTTDEEGGNKQYTAWLWKNWINPKSRKCETPVEWKVNVSIGMCTVSKKDNLTVGAAVNASGLVLTMWNFMARVPHRLTGAETMSYSLPGSVVFDENSCPCPESKPDHQIIVPIVEGCHTINFGSSDALYKQMDRAETELYGLKPFARAGEPQSLEEASERSFYGLLNTCLLDAGSPLYGDVSAVFSSSAVRSASLVSATDSGFWIVSCNASSTPRKDDMPRNCSAYDKLEGLGTVQHFNHVFLANHRFWRPLPTRSPLARIFSRLEGAWGTNPLTSYDLSTYFEIMPAATFLFASDIRFLIATFPNLFGTDMGVLVRRWAMQRGWVLLWSLGLNLEVNMAFRVLRHSEWPNVTANNRIIDPLVAQHSSASRSLNLSRSRLSSFDAKWKDVEKLRSAHLQHGEDIGNATWLVQWRQFAAGMEQQLHIDPLHPDDDCPRSGSGADVPECVGVTKTGVCLCYAHRAPDPLTILV